jgi:hypothetical protein
MPEIDLSRNKVIEDWARYTAERLQKSQEKKGVGKSGDLKYSTVYSTHGSPDISRVDHSFNFYGKFIDMGVGKGQKIEDVKANADLRAVTKIGRKPKKWLGKAYYAEVTELTDLLLQHDAQFLTTQIKNTFEGKSE